ncbi:MAG: TonB-dependent receptor plug domain-containing protein, partial [Pseudomonadota bacterium]
MALRNPARAFSAFLLCSAAAIPFTAHAQDAEAIEDAAVSEENTILVTGSRIRRQSQADLASPLATLGNEAIADIGAQNIGEITQTLTINSGAQNNPDAFTQGGTTGTSNINLRGLGVASTLILLDGKRQTLSAAPTNDGINFVDTSSLVPLIAVERVEILKDGASSLYGSDAVAGVVNFITRDSYEGVVLSGEYTDHLGTGN